MGYKRKDNNKRTQDSAVGKKRKKAPIVIPLPEDRHDDTSDVELSNEDLDLLEEQGDALHFLANLPKAEMDKEVSQAREKKKFTTKESLARSSRHRQHQDEEEEEKKEEEGRSLATHPRAKKYSDYSEDEGEEWERRPRGPSNNSKSRLHTDQSTLKAAPLPIKTLSGDIVINPDKTTPHNLSRSSMKSTHTEQKEPITVLPISVAGITVQDDLERVLEAQKAEEERRIKLAQAEADKKEEARRKAAAEKARKEREEAGGLGSLADYDSLEQRRGEAKKTMAVAAQSLLSDPEGQISKHMRSLLNLLNDFDSHVSRLAMLSLLAVMKDLIPGYKIRPVAEREQEGVVVSKEVRKLWDFESALVKSYQMYLKSLLSALNAAKSGTLPIAHGRVAARCLTTLLTTATHFNYASDLLQAVVPNMVHKDDQIREYCCHSIATLLQTALVGSGDVGQVAVEAVQLVADLIKRRNCVTPPEVVTSLLELSFPEIASGEDFIAARLDRKNKKKHKKKNKKDDVDKGFKEAQAVLDRETRRYQQSTILEALFEIYFRVIKTAAAALSTPNNTNHSHQDSIKASMPASRFSKKFPLLAPTMRGLSKFAHLISVDYFQDLMTALEGLLASASIPPAQRLRCLVTASELLRGQGEALTIDRRTFYNHLYEVLNQVALNPLVEDDVFTEADGDDDDGGTQTNVGLQLQFTAYVEDLSQVPTLLAKLMESMLLESRLLDAPRLAAFAKRAAETASGAGDTGLSMGLLCILHRMMRRYAKLRNMLDNESGGPAGSSSYKPENPDPAEAGALSVPLWELSLLACHYHPHVSRAGKDIAGMNVAAANSAAAAASGGSSSGAAGGSSVLPLGTTAPELAARYSTSKGGFRPAPDSSSMNKSQHQNQQSVSKSAKMKALARRRAADDPLILEKFAARFEQEENGGIVDASDIIRSPMDQSVIQALTAQYKMQKIFQENADLRREHMVVSRKVKMFHEHLQKMSQSRQHEGTNGMKRNRKK